MNQIIRNPTPPKVIGLRPPVPTRPVADTLLVAGAPTEEMIEVACRLTLLYELVFPEEPQRRTVQVPWQEEKMMKAVQDFLGDVNDYRFPVSDDMPYQCLDEARFYLDFIPVNMGGFSTSYDVSSWAYHPEPVRFLLMIAGEHNLARFFGVSLKAEYPGYLLPQDIELLQLADVLAGMSLPEPLDGLPTMIRMIYQETGNDWLDFCDEELSASGDYPDWFADYELLLSQWAEARPRLAQVGNLIEWVCADKETRLGAVAQWLIAADKKSKEIPDLEPNQTLIEVFASEETKETNVQRT
jgi:hypothetical protein